jgi:hypothetical protein
MEAIIRDLGEGRLYRLWILFSGKVLVKSAYKIYYMTFTFSIVLQ